MAVHLISVPMAARRQAAVPVIVAILGTLAMAVAGCSRPAADVSSPSASPAEVIPSPSASGQEASPTASAAPAGNGDATSVATAPLADVAPSGLGSLPWAAQATDAVLVGTIGSQVRLSLPPGRQILAVTPSLVVSSAVGPDGTSSTIYFASRASGANIFAPVTVAGQMIVGRLAGPWVYATGFDVASSSDPGVIAISIQDASVRSVIDPGPPPAGTVGPMGRNILVSGTGKTVISSVCTPASCSGGSVIDAASAKVIGTLQTIDGPSALNDSLVLVRGGGDVTTEMALVDISTGAELWREKNGDGFGFAYVTEIGSVVVGLSRSGSAQLASIDQRGDTRYSGPLPGRSPTLWPEVSTDSLAVIGDGGPFPGDVGVDGIAHAGVFDLDTWSFNADALQIDLSPSQP